MIGRQVYVAGLQAVNPWTTWFYSEFHLWVVTLGWGVMYVGAILVFYYVLIITIFNHRILKDLLHEVMVWEKFMPRLLNSLVCIILSWYKLRATLTEFLVVSFFSDVWSWVCVLNFAVSEHVCRKFWRHWFHPIKFR